MDGRGPALLRHGEERVDPEIALGRGGGADPIRLIGEPDMEGGPGGVTEDGDGPDVQLPAGPDQADGDLAAIGDQELGEQSALSTHNGIFPCFFARPVSRFVASEANA